MSSAKTGFELFPPLYQMMIKRVHVNILVLLQFSLKVLPPPRINQHYCNLCHDLVDGYHIGICKRNIRYNNYNSAENLSQYRHKM